MKVLVTSKSFGKTDDRPLRKLRDNGFEIVRFTGPSYEPEAIAKAVSGMDALVVGNDTINRTVLDAADSLKLIHMHGTGLDGIDVPAATEKGVLVANAPGANSNAVAEMAVALMLCSGRRIEQHSRLLREGRWERSAGHEISCSTVGLVGLGNIGKRIVVLLQGFTPSLLAFDPQGDPHWAAEYGVRLQDDVDTVFRHADFLVLALPLTPATKNMVNERTLALMKPSACIVNTARGGLVDDEALCRAIREKRLGGAALDAFSCEPLAMDSPLRQADVIITPHIAATSVESANRVSGIVADNLVAILSEGRKELAVNYGG